MSAVGADWFEVGLIPETLRATTLGAKRPGDPVNLEVDVARQVRRTTDAGDMTVMRLDSVERAIADIKAGKAVVVIDDEDRENEGDLIFAAELATPELVAFMVRYTSGYICVPLTEADADRLDLPPMFRVNQDRRGTAYAVTVDAREGVTTGISAADRAHTIRLLADPGANAADFARPGPRRAAAGEGRRRAAPPRAHRGGGRPGRARRAAARPACCARSSARRTRPAWPAPRSCGSSPTSTTSP